MQSISNVCGYGDPVMNDDAAIVQWSEDRVTVLPAVGIYEVIPDPVSSCAPHISIASPLVTMRIPTW